jgi:hypothetical protein
MLDRLGYCEGLAKNELEELEMLIVRCRLSDVGDSRSCVYAM